MLRGGVREPNLNKIQAQAADSACSHGKQSEARGCAYRMVELEKDVGLIGPQLPGIVCSRLCCCLFFFVSYKQENAEPTVKEGKQVWYDGAADLHDFPKRCVRAGGKGWKNSSTTTTSGTEAAGRTGGSGRRSAKGT